MSDRLQSQRFFGWIAMVAVAGLLSACQSPAAPKTGAAADKETGTYDEARGDGEGGAMGNY